MISDKRGVAGREARKIDAQPFGKRRVDIGDAPLLVGGKEPGRRMVEVIDRLLQVEEEAFLFGTLARDVGDLPCRQRLPLARHAEGSRSEPIPASARLGAKPDRLRQPELAIARLPVAQAGGQPIDDRRRFRHVRQQALHRLDVGCIGGARHVGIGAVCIDHPPLQVGDDEALPHRIDERLGQFVIGRARGKLHEADRRREQVADADHGEHAQHAEQEGVAESLAEDRKNDRRTGQHEEEDHQSRDDAGPHVLIDDRRRVEIVAGFPRHSPHACGIRATRVLPARLNHILHVAERPWQRLPLEKARHAASAGLLQRNRKRNLR